VLLASDGLFDNLHLDEIVAQMCQSPLLAAVQELVAAARKRMIEPADGQPSKPDDLTIVCYRKRPRKAV
jgi:serine/threonine protein phosphatase PrpC